MDDDGQRVHRLAVQEDVELHEVGCLVSDQVVVERGVPARGGLETVVEIQDDLVQRDLVRHHHPVGSDVLEIGLSAPALLAQGENGAHVLLRGDDDRPDERLLDGVDPPSVGNHRRVVDGDRLAVRQMNAIDDCRRRGDEREAKLALEPLLDDLHVEKAQEPAPETEPQGQRAFRLVAERGVVQAELLQCVPEVLVLTAVDRVEAGEDHRLHVLVPREDLGRRSVRLDDCIADPRVLDVPDSPEDVSDLSNAEAFGRDHLEGHRADGEDLVLAAGRREADSHSRNDPPVHDADQHHDALVVVEPGVEEEGAERRVGIPLRRGNPPDDRFQNVGRPAPLLGGGQDGPRRVDPDDVLDLDPHPLRIGGGQVDLVDHGNQFEIVFDGEVRVGQRLGLHPLRGVHDEERPFASREASRDLVRKIDVPRRIDEVQDVALPVLRPVIEPDGVRLDRDPPLPLQIHVVEDLIGLLAQRDRPRLLEQAVGERRLAVVDMGDDAEVSNSINRHKKSSARRRPSMAHAQPSGPRGPQQARVPPQARGQDLRPLRQP